MKEFVPLRHKIYNYLTDKITLIEGRKVQKKCVIKPDTKFENYKT